MDHTHLSLSVSPSLLPSGPWALDVCTCGDWVLGAAVPATGSLAFLDNIITEGAVAVTKCVQVSLSFDP